MDYSTGAVLAFVMGIRLIILIVFLSVLVLDIVARWNILEKAGEYGWKELIPFYREYMLFKISWRAAPYFVLLAYWIISLVLSFVCVINAGSTWAEGLFYVIFLLDWIFPFLIRIRLCIKLAASFGHDIGFVLGLIFLRPIFMLILAFDSSEYEG